ncbi:MAG TPA: leucine--tRNA ligase [Candidatus Polarisedimenticolia bacterium]|nr:leucine--tRNA ligase [Candidatus Polarisedimenticolia bacterium]
MGAFDFQRIEEKWQRIWEAEKTFAVDNQPDPEHPGYYCLEMLPYPSGRLHMGHVRNYTIGDAVARFKSARGFKVLHPMGWDSFGLPAENAAIKRKIHPRLWTEDNISQMRQQLKRLGYAYDWDREIAAHRPEYYRWNQWFFLKMHERGLAYRAHRWVNWCPTCETVLANEQVEGGVCWRCGTPVARKSLEQWFLKITAYAEELDAFLSKLPGWSERVRQMQRNWIGKSTGALVKLSVPDVPGLEPLEIFTTRIDTIFGATFCVLAPEHPAVEKLAAGTIQEAAVTDFVARMGKRNVVHQDALLGEAKEGVFTGAHAINPFTRERIPIWVGNFVLMEYGTGAIMAVPGNDVRDHEFARLYDLPIRPVVRPADPSTEVPSGQVYTEPGLLMNSGAYDGWPSDKAQEALIAQGEEKGFTRRMVQFRIRDWGVSRQRYWGTPIPMIHCAACGIVPVPEADLPVLLPEDVHLTGEGGSPLVSAPSFASVPCPRCGGDARRETDTMDTFFDSSWYFYRYADPKNDRAPFDPAAVDRWFPIDQYIGGITHAILHLIYCRFFTKVMRDMGLVRVDEPVVRLLNQGMVLKDGSAMSKSRGNVVEPDAMVNRYGADTCRLFALFAAPPERDMDWNEQGVEGCHRFLERVWRLASAQFGSPPPDGSAVKAAPSAREEALRRKTHQTILKVTEDLERRLHFNTAISAVMELVNELSAFHLEGVTTSSEIACFREGLDTVVRLLNPFAPHFTEEVWERLGHAQRLAHHAWPEPDLKVADEPLVEVIVQVNGKLRGKVRVEKGTPESDVLDRARGDSKVEAHLRGKTVSRSIFVPDRLLNLVVPG